MAKQYFSSTLDPSRKKKRHLPLKALSSGGQVLDRERGRAAVHEDFGGEVLRHHRERPGLRGALRASGVTKVLKGRFIHSAFKPQLKIQF